MSSVIVISLAPLLEEIEFESFQSGLADLKCKFASATSGFSTLEISGSILVNCALLKLAF